MHANTSMGVPETVPVRKRVSRMMFGRVLCFIASDWFYASWISLFSSLNSVVATNSLSLSFLVPFFSVHTSIGRSLIDVQYMLFCYEHPECATEILNDYFYFVIELAPQAIGF